MRRLIESVWEPGPPLTGRSHNRRHPFVAAITRSGQPADPTPAASQLVNIPTDWYAIRHDTENKTRAGTG